MLKPIYTFIEVLETIDQIDKAIDLERFMDVIGDDRQKYSSAQQKSIGAKLNEKYIYLRYGAGSS